MTRGLELALPDPFLPDPELFCRQVEGVLPSVQRQQDRRAEMLAVARRLLAVEGFQGFTIRRLSEVCGVTPPTIHNRFGSRNELLASALKEHADMMYRQSVRIAPPPLTFLTLAELWCRAADETPDFVRETMVASLSPKRPLLPVMSCHARRLKAQLLHEMRQKDLIRVNVDHALVGAHISQSITFSLFQWSLRLLSVADLRKQMIESIGLILLSSGTPKGTEKVEAWMDGRTGGK